MHKVNLKSTLPACNYKEVLLLQPSWWAGMGRGAHIWRALRADQDTH